MEQLNDENRNPQLLQVPTCNKTLLRKKFVSMDSMMAVVHVTDVSSPQQEQQPLPQQKQKMKQRQELKKTKSFGDHLRLLPTWTSTATAAQQTEHSRSASELDYANQFTYSVFTPTKSQRESDGEVVFVEKVWITLCALHYQAFA